MEERFSWNVVKTEDGSRLVLGGPITEETDFRPLLEKLDFSSLTVDLAGITRINSCGVREWLEFVGALEKRGVQLAFERCPPLIVTQINMISNFLGAKGQVRSVLAPYFCPSCDDEHQPLVDLSSGEEVELPDVVTCPTCGGDMEFDDIPEVFLDFARNST